jgi:hypothetical protein
MRFEIRFVGRHECEHLPCICGFVLKFAEERVIHAQGMLQW